MKNRIVLYSCILFLLVISLYIRNNLSSIYVQIGNYYYKQNNITNAQAYYEKAFAEGNNSARIVYVNSIINSPLTIESQRKLVKLAEDNIQDEASTKSKYFLYDLKREIHRQYPGNYIKQAPINQKIVRWNRFPITYTFTNSENTPKEYIEEIEKAFSDWEKSGTILFTQKDGNADISINFTNNNKPENLKYGQKYVVAYTVPDITSSKLNRMDVNFYINDPEGNPFSKNQIYNTALHEIFHALGFMGHSFEKDDIMYLAKDNNTLINDIRASLSEADINTLKLLYKIQPDITNQNDLKSEYVPYLVLGDDEELNLSKAKEAKNYIYHAPTLPGGYIDLAESLVAQKKYPEAIKNLEKALSLSDTKELQFIAYYNLAVAYNYIAHKEMALDYLDKAAEIKDEPELHYLRAEIYLKSDTNKAIDEYLYLVQLFPDKIEYITRLANIYIKKHEYLKARTVLKNFLKRNPSMKNDNRFSPYGILLW